MSVQYSTIAAQLAQGHTVVSYTKGRSMEPLLYEGRSYVVLAPLRSPLAVGDLPLFRRADGNYVLHRLVAMDDHWYYTRGDNCLGVERVPRDQMLGVVIEIVRKGRTISLQSRGYRAYVWLWRISTPVRLVFFGWRAIAAEWKRKCKS